MSVSELRCLGDEPRRMSVDGKELDVRRDGAMFGLGQDGNLFAAGRYPDLYLAKGPDAQAARSLIQEWFDKGIVDHPRGPAPRCIKGTSHRVVLFRKRRHTPSYLQIQLGEKQHRVHDLTDEEVDLLTRLEWVEVASARSASKIVVGGSAEGEKEASSAQPNVEANSGPGTVEQVHLRTTLIKVAQAAVEAARAAADAARATQLAAEAVAESVTNATHPQKPHDRE